MQLDIIWSKLFISIINPPIMSHIGIRFSNGQDFKFRNPVVFKILKFIILKFIYCTHFRFQKPDGFIYQFQEKLRAKSVILRKISF